MSGLEKDTHVKNRMKPQASPQMMPTTAAMGMAVTLSVVDTPARNTTASMPSLNTAEKHSSKMAQLVPLPPCCCFCRHNNDSVTARGQCT